MMASIVEPGRVISVQSTGMGTGVEVWKVEEGGAQYAVADANWSPVH